MSASEVKICDLPWGQLYVHSSGQVFPCNFLQNQVPLGHISEQSLLEIWNGPKMTDFRAAHRAKQQADCADRQNRFACYLVHRDLETAPSVGESLKDPAFPKRLDVMVDSACNLKCVMCTNIYEPSGGLKSERFWNANDALWPELEELEVVGGEPLLSPHFYRLSKLMLAKNPSCRWRMTTNAAYKIGKQLEETLLSLNLQTFAMSIDSIDPATFEAIRKNADFSSIVSNVDRFCGLLANKPGTKIAIYFLIQKMNAFELPHLFSWAESRGAKLEFTLLRQPLEHSVFEWPDQEKERLIQTYVRANESIGSLRLSHVIRRLFESLSASSRLSLADLVLDTFVQLKSKPA